MNPKYKRMIALMQKKEKARARRSGKKRNTGGKKAHAEPWFLYILKCRDGSLYTGITKDLERRFKMHNDGKASRYTRTRRPVEMVYQEPCAGRTQALVRECAVKMFPREKKERLIGTRQAQRMVNRPRRQPQKKSSPFIARSGIINF